MRNVSQYQASHPRSGQKGGQVMTHEMDRRKFLQASLAGVGLTLAFSVPGPDLLASAHAAAAEAQGGCMPNAWLNIAPDNTITILVSRSEMGQGVFTSMPMILAEELEADRKEVRVEASPTGPEYVDPVIKLQLTGGSMSVRHMFDPLRKVGAAAREMLRQAAAQEWKVAADECVAQQGMVKHAGTGRSLNYGDLCEKAAKMPVPKEPPLKKDSEFRLIGKTVPRVDATDKVNGAPLFGLDVVRPGMLHAVVARPPAYGAKALSFDKDEAQSVPGVKEVVEIESGVAICAESVSSALKGRDALNVKWGKGSHPDLNNALLEKLFAEGLNKKGVIAKKEGDPRSAYSEAAQKLEAYYSFPYLAHVAMEPINCTAHVQSDRCDIWLPTQFQTRALTTAAKLTGLAQDKVHVHATYLGGGFGRRTESAEVAEAVEISKNVGKPVKLLWTRDEDVKYDFFRPMNHHKIEAGSDANGRIIAWIHKVATQSVFERVFPSLIKNGIDPTAVQGIADQDYEIPNREVEWVRMELPVPVGFWRSVGHTSQAFAVECFIDELAHAAGKDPLAYRMAMLSSRSYGAGVLKTAAEKAGWGKPLPKGSGRGIAQHFSYGSHVAYVAEVRVNRESGVITVDRVVCAVDCGPVVNPDTVKAQMEGAANMALSVALKEEVMFENGGVKSRNFDDYPLLTISEAPEIEVHIVKSDHKRGGVGEPGIPPLAPAVGNAVFAAAGIRLRSLPMSPDRVRKALAQA